MAFWIKFKNLFSAWSKGRQFHVLSRIGGIWMFFDSRSQYCKVQAHVLNRIAQKHNLKTKYISLDDKGIPGVPEFVKDNGHASILGIKNTPTIVIAIPPKTYVFVSEGMTTEEQLEEQIRMAFEAIPEVLSVGFSSIQDQLKHRQELKNKKGV